VSSRGFQPRPTTYVFVDAGHLKKSFGEISHAWFGKAVDLYIPSLRTLFGAEKVFYYDSIDDVARAGESGEALDKRIKDQEAALREINAVSNTHVRYGSITGKDRRKRQKEVDILIAVDMMNHAIRQNMDRAVLVTGDRDFAPLVETLVQLGLTVEVAGDFRHTSDVLQAAADAYRPLGITTYAQMISPATARNMPKLPSLNGGPARDPASHTPSASGMTGQYECVLLPRSPNGFFAQFTHHENVMHVVVETIDDMRRLQLFLELEYGDASWLGDYVRRLS